MVEETGLPFLHGSAYVAVGDQSDNTVVAVERHAHAQQSFRDVDDGFAEVHVFGDDRKVFCAHDILGFGQQSLAELAARMELCEVAGAEVTHLHQRDGECVAHRQCSRRGGCGRKVQRTSLVINKHFDMDL